MPRDDIGVFLETRRMRKRKFLSQKEKKGRA